MLLYKFSIMIKIHLTFIFALLIAACTGQDNKTAHADADTVSMIDKSEKQWKESLTPEQFSILRLKGTDRPYTGKYYKTTDDGVYHCAGCGAALFTSDMKFDSDCGWPSFDKAMEGGKIKTQTDLSHGMMRTEILCAKCGGHLGHLFEDGPTETGLRYCVNSTSLNFVGKKK
jgi:peptide-methionine (R)-S-oxide reductase